MWLFQEVEDRAARLVKGVFAAPGVRDHARHEALSVAYDRACFAALGYVGMNGMADVLASAARKHQLVEAPPSRQIMSEAFRGAPLSLRTQMAIVGTIAAARDDGAKIPELKAYSEILRRRFPEADVLPPGSIIPSLHTPDPDLLVSLREACCPDADATAVSREMYAGKGVTVKAQSEALPLMEAGFETSGKEIKRGWFTLTEATANLVHAFYEANSKARNMRFELPLEEFAPADGLTGPRSGQVTRALPFKSGNLAPRGGTSEKS